MTSNYILVNIPRIQRREEEFIWLRQSSSSGQAPFQNSEGIKEKEGKSN